MMCLAKVRSLSWSQRERIKPNIKCKRKYELKIWHVKFIISKSYQKEKSRELRQKMETNNESKSQGISLTSPDWGYQAQGRLDRSGRGGGVGAWCYPRRRGVGCIDWERGSEKGEKDFITRLHTSSKLSLSTLSQQYDFVSPLSLNPHPHSIHIYTPTSALGWRLPGCWSSRWVCKLSPPSPPTQSVAPSPRVRLFACGRCRRRSRKKWGRRKRKEGVQVGEFGGVNEMGKERNWMDVKW